ncbi:MAG: A/G-specific adenine glycosylase [Oscillospiraceae bacterium]|nr:A/G-specific adenine glycosylase [Oscillospiraceae bacterium]
MINDTLTELIHPLLSWYHDHCRTLPWRSDPTPYHVWVSEIMLQQTRVAAVLGYYARFMEALPDIAALAEVEEDTLLKLWQGLGYYNRARNLQKAAQVIMSDHNGIFPGTFEEIIALPGIGDYTAGAISSIAFGLAEPAVDGNVLRVLTRILGDEGDITRPDTKRRIRQRIAETMPRNLPGAYNQALMELGALICLPNGQPNCDHCPVAAFCTAHLEGRTNELPVKAAKAPRKAEQRTVYLIFCEGNVALRRRPARGLLARLWEYPNALAEESPDFLPLLTVLEDGPDTKHIFTHREWHMHALVCSMAEDALPEGWVWADEQALSDRYAVPGAFDGFRDVVKEALNRDNL